MRTSPIASGDFAASVIAVPPLARHSDLSLNAEANRALIRHIEAGGVRTLMYAGNANFYHLPLSEYAATLDFLAEAAGPDTWIIPAAGADYGKLIDQAALLRERAFPTAVALPFGSPSNDAGVATALRRFAEAFGKPVIVYVKGLGYIEPSTLAALVRDGVACGIKYAIPRSDPTQDPFLDALVREVDRRQIVSGFGERPALSHMKHFGLAGFTSGSVCIAPRGSMRMLALARAKQWDEAERVRAAFMPIEDARDDYGAIRTLHDAITLAGIADMGPILPMLANLEAGERSRTQAAAKALLERDRTLAERV